MGSHKKPLFHPLVVVDSAGGKIFVRDDPRISPFLTRIWVDFTPIFSTVPLYQDDVIADSEKG